jgi:putative ABC transport system permease protein
MSIESRAEKAENYYSMNGGFFFLGVFLGLLFIMATVLIIYYKQISEGYEDAERYKIMQKVGLDRREIKRSISSQILVVFFMPLIVSAIHVAFDFKLMTMLLSLFGLVNNRLTLLCTAGTLGAFIIIYGTVYSLTAKAYYKIVS